MGGLLSKISGQDLRALLATGAVAGSVLVAGLVGTRARLMSRVASRKLMHICEAMGTGMAGRSGRMAGV